MSPAADGLALKRKRPDPRALTKNLSEAEQTLYSSIRSKENMGMWKKVMKVETKLPEAVVTKSLKVLLAKGLIKEVKTIQNKGKHYMAAEFEPSGDLTGGVWYEDGKFDAEFVKVLKEICVSITKKMKVATAEEISDAINKQRGLQFECTTQQITEIMGSLVLDNQIVECNETGDIDNIPTGAVCYKCSNKGGVSEIGKGAMASLPCGVCPRINECTPDGIISPTNCVYYTKWSEF